MNLIEKYKDFPKIYDVNKLENINDSLFYNKFNFTEVYDNIFVFPMIPKNVCNQVVQASLRQASYKKWINNGTPGYETQSIFLSDIDDNFYKSIENTMLKVVNHIWAFEKKDTFINNRIYVMKYSHDTISELKQHIDRSSVSFIIGLNDNTDYIEGGSYFKKWNHSINLKQGYAMIYYSGYIHSELKVMSGTRYLIAGFINHKDDCYTNALKQFFDSGKKHFQVINNQQVWDKIKCNY